MFQIYIFVDLDSNIKCTTSYITRKYIVDYVRNVITKWTHIYGIYHIIFT